MTQKTYSEKLKDPRWQKLRLEIMKRDKFTCKLCGDKETTLNIHHLKYTGDPWEALKSDLITYCEHCHKVAEIIKKRETGNPEKCKKYVFDHFIMLFVEIEGLIWVYEIDSGFAEFKTAFNHKLVVELVKFFKPKNNG